MSDSKEENDPGQKQEITGRQGAIEGEQQKGHAQELRQRQRHAQS